MIAACIVAVPTCAQSNRPAVSSNVPGLSISEEALKERLVAPADYQTRVARRLVEEANDAARTLGLDETFPIELSNVVSIYVSPPSMASMFGTVGNIGTRNYTYYVSVASMLSFVELAESKRQLDRVRSEYLWPLSRVDTNAAYRLATQWLGLLSMDVAALEHDCRVTIEPWFPEGSKSQSFVPLYWVYWRRTGREAEPVALVQLLEPTKKLWQLRVQQPEYIRRKRLETGTPTRSPQTTNASPQNLPGLNSSSNSGTGLYDGRGSGRSP